MTYKIEDFAAVEGEPNQWLHTTDGLFVGREGQTLESMVEEANAPFVPAVVVPDRVSRRQFRLQLIDAGLLDQVEGWIATQDIRTQAAYADSGTFLRSDEMLQQGFAGLGFATEQVDAFFTEAAGL